MGVGLIIVCFLVDIWLFDVVELAVYRLVYSFGCLILLFVGCRWLGLVDLAICGLFCDVWFVEGGIYFGAVLMILLLGLVYFGFMFILVRL